MVCVPPPAKVTVPPDAVMVPLFINPSPEPLKFTFAERAKLVLLPTVTVPARFKGAETLADTVPVVAKLFNTHTFPVRLVLVPVTVKLQILLPFTKLWLAVLP